jgi:DNA-binding CsgD family transcriptional regulator
MNNIRGLLTERQLQIVRLLLEGKGYREIAEELGVGTQAIKNQMSWAKARTGAHKLVELCGWVAVEDACNDD